MLYTNEQMLDLFEGYLSQAETPAEPELLYSPIVYSMSGGGKRLRPLLLLLTAPFSEFLLGMEADMLRAIQRMLLMMGG